MGFLPPMHHAADEYDPTDNTLDGSPMGKIVDAKADPNSEIAQGFSRALADYNARWKRSRSSEFVQGHEDAHKG